MSELKRLDLAALALEVAENGKAQSKKWNPEDEVTEKIFLGQGCAELEIMSWSQFPEFYIP